MEMPSTTFPLFRLPLVVLDEVIDHFPLNYLVILSFCSKKSQVIAKKLRKKSLKVCIDAVYCKFAKVCLKNAFDPILPETDPAQIQYSHINISKLTESNPKTELVRIGEFLIPFIRNHDERGQIMLEFHFDDLFFGLKTVLNYATWFFEVPMNACALTSQMDPDQIPRFLDYATKKQESIHNLYVECACTGDAQIQKIMDVCNFANEFFMEVKPSPEFQHQFIFEGKKSIDLRNAFWFNLENLYKINSRFITLYDSKFTNIEMNQYLKKWMTGSFPRIKHVFIEMETIDINILLTELNAVEFPEGEKRTFQNRANIATTIQYGFDIRRNDGTIATIVHHGGRFISDKFEIVVW